MAKKDSPESRKERTARIRAQVAKVVIRSMIMRNGRPVWFHGIGIARDDKGAYYVTVRVSKITPKVRKAIPETELYGVEIRLEEQGTVSAR